MPHRYRRAWRELLERCPDGMSEWQWAQAIYDARDLFAAWGAEIEQMRWFERVKDDGRAEAALIAAAGLLRKGAPQ